jgi:hypothetical protein
MRILKHNRLPAVSVSVSIFLLSHSPYSCRARKKKYPTYHESHYKLEAVIVTLWHSLKVSTDSMSIDIVDETIGVGDLDDMSSRLFMMRLRHTLLWRSMGILCCFRHYHIINERNVKRREAWMIPPKLVVRSKE